MKFMFLTILFVLLFLHLLIDFPFQPNKWAESKKDRNFRSFWLYLHSLLQGGVFSLAWFLLYGIETDVPFTLTDLLGYSFLLTFLHAIIDGGKAFLDKKVRVAQETSREYCKILFFTPSKTYLLDQTLHLCIIVFCWLRLTGQGGVFLQGMIEFDYTKVMILFFAYLLLYMPTGILIGLLLKKWEPQQATDHQASGTTLTNNNNNNSDLASSLIKAGTWIGYLERTLILTFVLTNNISAVGFLFAAKSIFRFGELNDAKFVKQTEYVLLGTLYSYTIALTVGFMLIHALEPKLDVFSGLLMCK